jgi:hypothetical protein
MRNHILLPALQFAAAAFFAKAALAAPTADNTHTDNMDMMDPDMEHATYCVDADHRVVATSACDDSARAAAASNGGIKLMTVQGPVGLAIGDVHVPMAMPTATPTAHVKRSNVAREQEEHEERDEEMVSGGFGVEERDEASSTTSSKGSRPTGS